METYDSQTPEQQVPTGQPNNGDQPRAVQGAQSQQPFVQRQPISTQQVLDWAANFTNIVQLSLARGDAMYAELEHLKSQMQMITNSIRANAFAPPAKVEVPRADTTKMFADIVSLSKKVSSLESKIKEKDTELSKVKIIAEQLESKIKVLEKNNGKKTDRIESRSDKNGS